ncbi:ATP-dependent RNA helicase DbpA [Corallococcus exiguus]|uniref:ATP-dependent RNA helicase DbpA n=1 Tax=Corallococcus TaxID=83461 RepID=UPI000EA3AF72|nr:MULTISPECIES: ATP-dependent RNA helicase DbpA [Corallococcus]RKI26601.1 ATP-dependent RNA helicase DbpA [Corallococcus sp. AB004]NPC76181.1 ATP-dependent RNA helicase DbpA [Corallococcus exiguus]NPD24335.1 ATP-dependent RNA helicase DbpA [Corallococcus exiguus]NRD50919.1 ATP-dependent RNA helicase DbpA [Corallococcus exiguus]NRD67744.1 ATP-dependent RNA helicase DbpA [Corallococcus exiguus]
MEFSALSLSPPLLQVLEELEFKTATPIQAQSIPVLLQGKDLVGQARTGSGKTAAFALPILQKVKLTQDRRLQALVLCPTRELCAQVAGEIRRLARRMPGVQVLALAGGQPIRPQVEALEKGAHIGVGTPGRIIDLLDREVLDTRHLATVVLDEADRMLDMGFREDMERVLGATPSKRQTVLFSATFPDDIEKLSRAFQKDPVRVSLAQEEAAPDIQQVGYACTPEEKQTLLLRLLRQHQPASAIVFCNFKAVVVELTRALVQAGVSADGLQGDLEQFDRDRVMAKFRNHSTRVLVATDVAGRGIDVEALDAVVNYELPQQPEAYVHRIGRTGRAGRRGLALSLVTRSDSRKVEDIEGTTGVKLEKGDVDALVPENVPGVSLMSGWETLSISAGRKDKMRPGDILGALTGEAGGLKAEDVGKIEIHDHHAFVAVSKRVVKVAFQRLSEGRIKGRKHRIERVR